MEVIVGKLNGILWGPWFIYGILLIGLFSQSSQDFYKLDTLKTCLF